MLTNRAELCEKLGVSPSGIPQSSDDLLILLAFVKWGERCAEFLAGDFAFVIWDDNAKRLFCCRDHYGASPLFYHLKDGHFSFSSDPSGIFLVSNAERRFNVNKLSTLLLPEPHTYLAEESWFEEILAFPPGSFMWGDRRGFTFRTYWEPEMPNLPRFKSQGEWLEAIRELMFDVIGARLQRVERPASLLSGGLDSSSIVSVAAKILERQNGIIDVFAAVLADENDAQYVDERYYIDLFKNNPNVRINYVSAPQKGPFSDLDEFFRDHDSPFITSRQYLYSAFSREAERAGSAVVFDGTFGESGISNHGSGAFAEMFRSFHWIRLWRELRMRRSLYGDSVIYNLRANTINPLLPRSLIALRRGNNASELSPVDLHPVRDELARSLLEDIDISKFVRGRPLPDCAQNQLGEIAFVQKKLTDLPGARFGGSRVEFRYPLLDKRLIDLTLSVPTDLKVRKGFNRHLVRAGLDGILPPEIQWRTTKTPFSPDYLRRYSSQIPMVRELLSSITQKDPINQLIDIERLKSWSELSVRPDERYTTNERIARDHLPQAVYLISFLKTFSDFRA